MLKKVFGVYINPDAVGWVTHEQVFRVEGKPDVVRQDTIEVFTKKGAMCSDLRSSALRREIIGVSCPQSGSWQLLVIDLSAFPY